MTSLYELREMHPPKFKEGDVVFEITRPQQLMLIINQKGFIYSCRSLDNSKAREVVYMEKELKQQLHSSISYNRSKTS